MHSADVPPDTSPHEEAHDEAPDLWRLRTRLAWVLLVILVVLVLVFIPPLISVSRFQRRIASNLSAALGRPVHLDRVTLSLVPLPGFTLENFVVDEDPAFGYEPILRANEVHAAIRLTSLWSSHVEFSRISLSEPTSVNLVRLPDGRWNFESVLLRASRVEAAPTAQSYSGPAPRFPYVEASGARINFKQGQQKMPFALSNGDFSLWLPGPRQWRFRLAAQPVRTDVPSSDSGLLRIQGSLGDAATRAATLGEVPIDLRANWDPAPLAGVGRIVLGRDPGIRGDLTLDLHAMGSVAHAALTANVAFTQLRRSEFIPSHLVQFQASCQALASDQFSSFSGVECHSPEPSVLIATATLPDSAHLASGSGTLTVPALPAATIVDWLQAATAHPPALTGPGLLAGALAWNAANQPPLSGQLELSGESVQLSENGLPHPVLLGNLLLHSASPALAAPGTGHARGSAKNASMATPALTGSVFVLDPVSISLGARLPATVQGQFDRAGYTVRLSGPATLERILAFAEAVPQLGDGLRACLEPPGNEPSASAGGAAVPAAQTPASAAGESALAQPASSGTSNGASGKITSPVDARPSAASASAASRSAGNGVATATKTKDSEEEARTAVIHLELTATRAWGEPQHWTGCPAPAAPRPAHD